jgi:hypothetical protein
MRKLLLVMLVPFLVLGVMGCSGIDADVQTDYRVQGAWVAEAEGYTLIINAGTMVVKYQDDVSTPYRTEWSPGAYDPSDVALALIDGEMTLFDYKTNDEIATIIISCVPGDSLTIDPDVDWNVEEYYYSNAFPKSTTYAFVGPTKPTGPTDVADLKFTLPAAYEKLVYAMATGWPGVKLAQADIGYDATQTKGVALTYSGFKVTDPAGDAVDAALDATSPAGEYTVTFDVADDMANNIKGGTVTLTFEIAKAKTTAALFAVTPLTGTARPTVAVFAAASGGTITLGTGNAKIEITKIYLTSDTAKTAITGALTAAAHTIVFSYAGDDNFEAAEDLEISYTPN